MRQDHLTGEYAVVFGLPGIAVPAPVQLTAMFRPAATTTIYWPQIEPFPQWQEYLREILHLLNTTGEITIENYIPLGKGMGSSTALIIAVAKAILGEDCKEQALAIEDALNPGHSGIDFEVIWEETPMKFEKGKHPEKIDLPDDLLANAILIDTGRPMETTVELVAWMQKRQNDIQGSLDQIAQCTKQLVSKRNLKDVMRRHHKAQVALDIVPGTVKALIADIEQRGGAAKVLGAGARNGGGGMVLALHSHPETLKHICNELGFPHTHLS